MDSKTNRQIDVSLKEATENEMVSNDLESADYRKK